MHLQWGDGRALLLGFGANTKREARRAGRKNRRASPGHPEWVWCGIGFVSSEMLDLIDTARLH
tara:strand:- start:184 stop:372 length:189 start_codon:yes stop_codon:yes gene_type:complete